ncbi:MAG TPA: hypothetical protein VLR88_02845 [Propionibacteriaceae bacterium]|nr:hypothetical protein [Propionibacteriaceae bacterium]
MPTPLVRRLYAITAIATFLTVMLGAVNSATESGMACPTWPGCYPEKFGPVAEIHPLIEFVHRVVAFSTGPLLLAAAVAGLRLGRQHLRAKILPWLAIACAGVSAICGAIVVLHGLPRAWAVVDLGCALICLLAMNLAWVQVRQDTPVWPWTAHSKLAWSAVGLTWAMHLIAMETSGAGSFTACLGWPTWTIIDSDRLPWLQVVRIVVGLAAGVLLVATAARAVRTPKLATHGWTLLGLFAVEMGLGQWIAVHPSRMWLAAAYCATAAAILWTLGLLAARVSLMSAASEVVPESERTLDAVH